MEPEYVYVPSVHVWHPGAASVPLTVRLTLGAYNRLLAIHANDRGIAIHLQSVFDQALEHDLDPDRDCDERNSDG